MSSPKKTPIQLSCPFPIQNYPRVLMAHGGGGKLMHQLLNDLVLPSLGIDSKQPQHDAAALTLEHNRIAYTTDSYVIHPLQFPGGDIGSLSVHGTANDLAMGGARPRFLSVGLVLEEGLSMELLAQILQSMKRAADEIGIRIVTGDTKVVERGKADGLYINTSGIGVVPENRSVRPQNIAPGDSILLNGDIGRHGVAVLSRREGLEFETAIVSDSAHVHRQVEALFDQGIEVHCLRDLTRGGLASALNELAAAAGCRMETEETEIPIRPEVASACELLGLDPLHVACEGRFAAFVPSPQSNKALQILKSLDSEETPRIIGRVTANEPGRFDRVSLKTRYGVHRVLDMLSGEQLPRIC